MEENIPADLAEGDIPGIDSEEVRLLSVQYCHCVQVSRYTLTLPIFAQELLSTKFELSKMQ